MTRDAAQRKAKIEVGLFTKLSYIWWISILKAQDACQGRKKKIVKKIIEEIVAGARFEQACFAANLYLTRVYNGF